MASKGYKMWVEEVHDLFTDTNFLPIGTPNAEKYKSGSEEAVAIHQEAVTAGVDQRGDAHW